VGGTSDYGTLQTDGGGLVSTALSIKADVPVQRLPILGYLVAVLGASALRAFYFWR
jgi:hypothetical protein